MLTVTLPSGRFTSAPVLVGNISNGTTGFMVVFQSIGTTSFQVGAKRWDDNSFRIQDINWLALQLSP
jgi:hypothetical protein